MSVDPAMCKSCSAPVFWAETERGKSMLVDMVATRPGNLRITERPGRAPLAAVVPAHLAYGQMLHVSHFSTCPAAKSHRRRGAA